MQSIAVTPRTLADDSLIMTAGYSHVEKLLEATRHTHSYLQIMGAKVATNKSLRFASTKMQRKGSKLISGPIQKE